MDNQPQTSSTDCERPEFGWSDKPIHNSKGLHLIERVCEYGDLPDDFARFICQITVLVGRDAQGQELTASEVREIHEFDAEDAFAVAAENLKGWCDELRGKARQEMFAKKLQLPNGTIVR